MKCHRVLLFVAAGTASFALAACGSESQGPDGEAAGDGGAPDVQSHDDGAAAHDAGAGDAAPHADGASSSDATSGDGAGNDASGDGSSPASGQGDIGPVLDGPNPGSTSLVRLLPRPGGFYAIYTDNRSWDGIAHVNIRGERLSSTLDAVDTSGMPLPLPDETQGADGAYDGTGIVLASIAVLPSTTTYTINVSRVSESGTTLLAPKPIATSTDQVSQLRVAHDGSQAVVVWLEQGTSMTLRAASVDASGAVTGGPWAIAQDPEGFTIAASQGKTVIAWTSLVTTSQIQAVTIATGGAPSTPSVLATRTYPGFLDVVPTTGGNWFVAWSETPVSGTQSLVGAPWPAGGPLGSIVTIDSLASQYAIFPELAFSGTDVRATWSTYLDVRTRTVPLSGAPATPMNVLRSQLAFAAGPHVACSEGVCGGGWTEAVGTQNIESAAKVTRLAGDSTAQDVPAKEISFPADEEQAPVFAQDGHTLDVVFERAVGRNPPDVVLRRFDATAAAWLDPAPAVVTTNGNVAGIAAPAGGGALLATRAPFLGTDYTIHGHALSSAGTVTDLGAWASPYERPLAVALACATTRCAMLYEQQQLYMSVALDAAGTVLTPTNGSVPSLGQPDWVHLRGAGTSFLVAWEGYGVPFRAAIATETGFPTFGSPIALQAVAASTNRDVHSAARGGTVGLAWSKLNSCQVLARAVDTVQGAAVGSDAVILHDCTSSYVEVNDIAATATGYTVLYSVRNGPGAGTFYRRDVDATMNPVAPEQLVASIPQAAVGVELLPVANKSVYTYAVLDDSPGIGSQRAKILGL